MRNVKVLTMLLAGGIGERLYPLTADRSKPAVPFGGNFRIIDFTLMNCVMSGLRQIHVLTQYHSFSLSQHKTERWNFLSQELGEFVELVPPKMRTTNGFYQGTADAIFRNLELLDRHRPDVVLVLSGDHVYRADYNRLIESHLNNQADVTVLSDWIDQDEASSFGCIEGADGRILNFVEKPEDPSPYATNGRCQINLGVYCFRTRFLVEQLVQDSKRKTAHDFGKNILPESLDKGQVMSCPLEAICPDDQPYWRDVGTLDSYYQANMDLLKNPQPFQLRDSRWAEKSRFHELLPASFPSTKPGEVTGRNMIAPGCEVGAAQVNNSILSQNVRIGEGSIVDGCILFPGVEVGRNVELRNCIIEEGIRVPDRTILTSETGHEQCIRTEKGVVVVSANYRFEQPKSVVVRGSGERSKQRRKTSARRGTNRIRATNKQLG